MSLTVHKGLFRYTRLPYGIASAPGIFQKAMEQLLQGIAGIAVYIDDILVTGGDEDEHLKSLEEVLKRLQGIIANQYLAGLEEGPSSSLDNRVCGRERLDISIEFHRRTASATLDLKYLTLV